MHIYTHTHTHTHTYTYLNMNPVLKAADQQMCLSDDASHTCS